MKKKGTGTAPGTCGEIVQGQFSVGENFLVTFPVDLWSQVSIEIDEDYAGITCTPAEKTKSCRAVSLLLAELNYQHIGARLTFNSDIPVGKGMASSTADITAACRAVGDALDVEISPELISHIAAQIEPSDGNMYTGVVCYDHISCRLVEALGLPPPAALLVVDFGDEVDTVAYNQRPKQYTQADFAICRDAYEKVRQGIRAGDLSLVGEAAAVSARLNQKFLYKPDLEALIKISGGYGAYGVCIGHSGTIAALIFAPDSPHIPQVQEQIAQAFPAIHSTFLVRTLPQKGHLDDH